MITPESKQIRKPGAWTRRSVLKAGGLGLCGLAANGISVDTASAAVSEAAAAGFGRAKSVVVLFLVGAPSQIDTWDMKPDAPEPIRGPFRPIATNVPGVDICEHFPLSARLADKFAIVRSVYSNDAPIHEAGHQRAMTGFAFRGGLDYPAQGSVAALLQGSRGASPPYVVLNGPIKNAGDRVPHGQESGYLGRKFDAVYSHPTWDSADGPGEPESVLARYGRGTFAQSCLRARCLVEAGARFVTVNMFDSLHDETTWDCHGTVGSLAGTLDDYAKTLMPTLDQAYSALIEDLSRRGLLDDTLVVCMGEFGRAPRIGTPIKGGAGAGAFGRDHWTGVWSLLMAGAGVVGGQVIGASDRIGAEPKERPVQSGDISATIYHALGIPLDTSLPGPSGERRALLEARAKPVLELYGSC